MPQVSKQTSKPVVSVKAKGGILGRIGPIDFSQDEGIKLLVYGRSKTGKSTFCSTFPGPILWLICSGNNKAGELRSVNTPENRKKIKKVSIEATTEVQEIIKHQQATGEFKTIVLDHASGFQDKTLAEILGLDELPAQKTWGLATHQQYGQCTLQCKEHFRGLLGLDCNVLIIAQEREFNTDNDNSELLTPSVGAALSPALVGWLNPACDYIVQTFIRPKMISKSVSVGGKATTVLQRGTGYEYCLRVGPHDVYTTGFRVPKGKELPECIVDPTYSSFIKLASGG